MESDPEKYFKNISDHVITSNIIHNLGMYFNANHANSIESFDKVKYYSNRINIKGL